MSDPAEETRADPVGGEVGEVGEVGHVDEVDETPEKGAAVMSYIACALLPIGFVLGPLATLLIWRLRRHDPFADFHGRQALDVTFAGIVASLAVWLLLRLGHATLTPRGMGGFVANMAWTQFAVVALYVGLLLWGAVAAVRGQRLVLPLGLPFLRAMAKNEDTVEVDHGS